MPITEEPPSAPMMADSTTMDCSQSSASTSTSTSAPSSSRENSVSPTPSFRKPPKQKQCPPPCKKEESSRFWFRFEMLRMVCVIFIACMSIFLKEDTLPTRPLPNHFTQIGTIHHMRFGNNNNSQTLLSVPFYVYESLLWDNMTFQGQNLSALLERTPLKQSEDYWFQKAALVHPMRTFDPEQARLFVVPTLMNFASDGVALSKQHGKLPTQRSGACHNGLCNRLLVEQAEMVLADSEYYQRSNGSDHVMVMSNWFSSRYDLIQESPVFRNLNLIRFEDRELAPDNNRTSFPSTYVGNPCVPAETEKPYDFVFVGNLWPKANRPKRQRFQSRRDVCDWLLSGYNTSLCGQGDQCPALARSRYGFHVRGDTFGANRLLDTLLSGTVPVFTDDQQYDVLPSWIDWKLLSVQANVTSREEFHQSIDSILNTTNYEEKRRHVLNNRDLLDWRTGVPFDVYMYMFQRAILPESVMESSSDGTVKNPYNFTALLL